jgi:CRISPR-associated protein Cas1
MSTLYVDRKNVRLELDAEALVFFENGERIGTVPLAPLSRIVMRGNVTVDTSLLGKLGAHGIGVIVLSGRKAEPSLFLPRTHNDAERRLAQYRAACDPTLCYILSQDIVRQKLQSQLDFIEDRLQTRHDARYELSRAARGIAGMLGQIETQPDIPALRGLEGSAANLYFFAYAALVPESLGFKGRNRRPPRDPVNAVLSLSYTLLHAEAVLAAHAAGLDPAIGFFHQTSFGRESLASDLIEPCRADVDRWTLALFNRQVLRAEDFSTTADGCLLGKAGRGRYYLEWEPMAEHLRRHLDRQTRVLVHAIQPGSPEPDEAGFDQSVLIEPAIRPA